MLLILNYRLLGERFSRTDPRSLFNMVSSGAAGVLVIAKIIFLRDDELICLKLSYLCFVGVGIALSAVSFSFMSTIGVTLASIGRIRSTASG